MNRNSTSLTMNSQATQQFLTAIFMLLAVAAIVVFFVSPNRIWFYGLGISAVVIRLIQYGMRFFGRGKRRREKVDFDFDNDNK